MDELPNKKKLRVYGRHEELEQINHSGYDLLTPWRLLRSTRPHEYHHSHNKGAYGIFPFWDRLMGTDEAYYLEHHT